MAAQQLALFEGLPEWFPLPTGEVPIVTAEYEEDGDEETNLTHETIKQVFDYSELRYFTLWHGKHSRTLLWATFHGGKDGSETDGAYIQGWLYEAELLKVVGEPLARNIPFPESVIAKYKGVEFTIPKDKVCIRDANEPERVFKTIHDALKANVEELVIGGVSEEHGVAIYFHTTGEGRPLFVKARVNPAKHAWHYRRAVRAWLTKDLEASAEALAKAHKHHLKMQRLVQELELHEEAVIHEMTKEPA